MTYYSPLGSTSFTFFGTGAPVVAKVPTAPVYAGSVVATSAPSDAWREAVKIAASNFLDQVGMTAGRYPNWQKRVAKLSDAIGWKQASASDSLAQLQARRIPVIETADVLFSLSEWPRTTAAQKSAAEAARTNLVNARVALQSAMDAATRMARAEAEAAALLRQQQEQEATRLANEARVRAAEEAARLANERAAAAEAAAAQNAQMAPPVNPVDVECSDGYYRDSSGVCLPASPVMVAPTPPPSPAVSPAPSPELPSLLSREEYFGVPRKTLFIGAGVAGAAMIALALMPSRKVQANRRKRRSSRR